MEFFKVVFLGIVILEDIFFLGVRICIFFMIGWFLEVRLRAIDMVI